MTDVRDASTLILVAGSDLACDPPKVLTIIRASNLNYLPDALVFPGGNFDKNDEHVDWLSIIPIEEQNVNLNSKISSTAQVSRALSSRITAIRETFEECCILLCKRYNDPKISKVTPLFINDSKRWRQKIRTNSYEFLNLCRSYRCYPDVRGLYFISTWITPPHFTRRYNCKFFAAVTDYVVDGDIDTTEVQSMEVSTRHQSVQLPFLLDFYKLIHALIFSGNPLLIAIRTNRSLFPLPNFTNCLNSKNFETLIRFSIL